MNFFPSLKEIRAAHALSLAMSEGQAPNAKALKDLGLSPKMAKNFKR